MQMARIVALFVVALVAGVSAQQDGCTAYANQSNCAAGNKRLGRLPGAPKPADAVAFIVLGDYGYAPAGCEADVAHLIESIDQQLGPLDYIMTVGDNNYYQGSCDSIDANIHQYFGDWYPEPGRCTNPGSTTPSAPLKPRLRSGADNKIRFFPTLGNHDFDTYSQYGTKLPYFQHFQYLLKLAPEEAQGQYYSVDPIVVSEGNQSLAGIVQLFGINSNLENSTKQPEWLQAALANSTSPWKLVYFHHSPYTTAQHDPVATWMRWPFEQWGASAVFTGHEHTYERLLKSPDGSAGTFTYVVNGLGGNPLLYDISGPNCPPDPGSVVRFNGGHGAMLVYATKSYLSMTMYTTDGDIVDSAVLKSTR